MNSSIVRAQRQCLRAVSDAASCRRQISGPRILNFEDLSFSEFPTQPFLLSRMRLKPLPPACPTLRCSSGQNATTERLRQKIPTSRFIHIAYPRLLSRDNPMFSGIGSWNEVPARRSK